MLHEPATPSGPDPASEYKVRLGIWMFIAYVIFYAGYVALRLISPEIMASTLFLGLNVAIIYGFALIIIALLQALVYNHLCTKRERLLAAASAKKER